MPRYLNENDIEQMLDIPDDGSEDGFESDEAEEFNVNTIQRLLEAPDDSSDLLQNSPTHLNTTPNSCSESGTSTIALCSQLDNSQPVKPLIVQSSSPLEQELTDESKCEDESWGKVFWTSRPDPDEFDKVTIKPRYLLNRRARPVAHFKKFFSDEAFDLIVTQTNLYAEQQNIKNWQPVDTQEISAFLGILIIMGYHILPHIDLYWSSDPGFRVNEIAEVMPVKRFKKILEALHLNDNNQQPSREDVNFDKLYKIRPLISLLSQSFENNAFNSSSQSIDESMILFKGRSSLKQYMPLKPIKRGYKVWCCCDSSTGYLYNYEIYTGKTGQGTEEGLGANVVKKLSSKLAQENFKSHVTFDNFFCDFSLMQYLYEKNIYATGTVRRNRAILPNIIKNNTKRNGRNKSLKLKKGEFKWRTKQDVAFIVWQDTKEVLLLTTAFHPKVEVTTVQRTQKNGTREAVSCPMVVKEYTKRMGGVDRFDQVKGTYAVGRRSKRWWLRIFYFLVDASLTNSFILYSLTSRVEKLTNLEFRVAVARGLIGGYSSRKRRSSLPTYICKKSRIACPEVYQKTINAVPEELRFVNVGDHMPAELETYRRCKLCSTKVKDKRSKIKCSKCNVPLCITPCFAQFHRK